MSNSYRGTIINDSEYRKWVIKRHGLMYSDYWYMMDKCFKDVIE